MGIFKLTLVELLSLTDLFDPFLHGFALLLDLKSLLSGIPFFGFLSLFLNLRVPGLPLAILRLILGVRLLGWGRHRRACLQISLAELFFGLRASEHSSSLRSAQPLVEVRGGVLPLLAGVVLGPFQLVFELLVLLLFLGVEVVLALVVGVAGHCLVLPKALGAKNVKK